MPPEVACDFSDVLRQQVGRIFRGGETREPTWELVMPAEIVASKLLTVLGCKGQKRVGSSEVVAFRLRVDDLPFHVVFTNDDAGLLRQKVSEVGTLQLPGRDSRADEQILFGPYLAEGGLRGLKRE